MKRVLTYGSFDLLHVGHVRLLDRAASMGDELYVGLSTQRFSSLKGKHPFYRYSDRAEILRALRSVTCVFPEECWEQKVEDVRRLRIDTFVIGEDWKGKFDFLKTFCSVVYLPRTDGISTSQTKQALASSVL